MLFKVKLGLTSREKGKKNLQMGLHKLWMAPRVVYVFSTWNIALRLNMIG